MRISILIIITGLHVLHWITISSCKTIDLLTLITSLDWVLSTGEVMCPTIPGSITISHPSCCPVKLLGEGGSVPGGSHCRDTKRHVPLHPRELRFLPCFGTLCYTIRQGPVTEEGAGGERQSLDFLQADHYLARCGLNRIPRSSGLEWSVALIFHRKGNGLTKDKFQTCSSFEKRGISPDQV